MEFIKKGGYSQPTKPANPVAPSQRRMPIKDQPKTHYIVIEATDTTYKDALRIKESAKKWAKDHFIDPRDGHGDVPNITIEADEAPKTKRPFVPRTDRIDNEQVIGVDVSGATVTIVQRPRRFELELVEDESTEGVLIIRDKETHIPYGLVGIDEDGESITHVFIHTHGRDPMPHC